MFAPTDDPVPSRPTALTPAPTFENTFDPRSHNDPPDTLAKARTLAHLLARPYVLWNGRLYIAVSAHQHLRTDFTVADVPGLVASE